MILADWQKRSVCEASGTRFYPGVSIGRSFKMSDLQSDMLDSRPFGISVIMPCYNGAAFIGAAIDSVIEQGYQGNLEILVGDDGSTDNSLKVVSKYGSLVRVLHHPGKENRGLMATRNLCIANAKYSLLAFLDCDDLFLPGHLQRASEFFLSRPNIEFYADAGLLVQSDGKHIGRKDDPHPGGIILAEEVLLNQWFPPAAVVLRREAIIAAGGFSENMKSVEDQDLWLRILEQQSGFYSKELGYAYRIHDAQMTNDPILWDWAEVSLRRAVQRYPYSSRVVRRRKAVIAYRRALSARESDRWLKYTLMMGLAFCLDPVRGLRELAKRSGLVYR